MHAIDENGRSLILNEDGSWQFDNSKEWRVVRTYMGDSTDKNTDLFEINNPQWRVRVSTEESLSVNWNEKESSDFDYLISMDFPGSDESYVYLRGIFYLEIRLDFVTTQSAKSVIAQKLERKNAKLPPRTEAT